MKAHHLYSTATTLATAVLLAAPSLADQTISDTQTKAVNMTEGKLTVTGTGFLNVAKNAVNLKDPIQSALEIAVMEGGRISGKSALVLDQGMENGITGQLISVTNSGTMTGTEKQAIDLRYMINTSATITNNGSDIPGTILKLCPESFVKIFNEADVIIAKGQGNFESLNGTTDHKNLFYLFLCKCNHFMKTFGVEQNEMVLVQNKT